jgi:hypothetical protein
MDVAEPKLTQPFVVPIGPIQRHGLERMNAEQQNRALPIETAILSQEEHAP